MLVSCAQLCLYLYRATQPVIPIHPIPVPSRRFTHVHADLVGPMPVSSGDHSHVMTVIDQSTRWVEVFPLSSTATACADTFVAGWIASFGVPASITTDREVQFTCLWLSGPSSASAWVCNISPQQLTTHNETVLLRDFTGS